MRLAHSRPDHRGADRDQHVRPQLQQLNRETGKAIVMAFAEAKIDDDVLPVDVAKLRQTLAESGLPR